MDASSINPTRTQHACRPCRDLKVKCHPCPKGGDVCKKCQRSGASCIIEEPKQRRKRKAPDDRITVSVLEGKLAELAKQLETKNDRLYPQHDIKSSICSSFQGNLPQGIIDYAADYVPMADSGAHISGHSSPDKIESLVDQLLGQGCLKASTAESYLAKYQQMCAYFPFVPISEKATVRSLRQTQPFLLHAILAVSSRENQGLQHVLDRKLREDLLKAVIMDGEKSIDLLQAFLVYLAWEQFFYVPKKRHTNQMLQIAASLCVEMGLDLGPREASVRKFGLHLDHHFSAGGTGDDLFFSKPARRAYIGCCYLSAASALIWRTKSSLHCTDYMIQCAQSLASEFEFDSDVLIPTLLRIQILGNEYHEILSSASIDYTTSSYPEGLHAHLSTFQARLDQLSSIDPHTLLDRLPLDLAAQVAAMHAHEIGCLSPSVPFKDHTENAKDGLPISRAQLPVLVVCMNSARAFVESFLSIPVSEYSKLSTLQWWGLICSIFILYTFSTGIRRLPQWDVAIARDKFKLEIYLDLLYYRMRSTITSPGDAPVGRDLFSLMSSIFASVRDTYERLKKLPQHQSSNGGEPAHIMAVFEGHQKSVRPFPRSRCPVFSVWSSDLTSTNSSAGICTDTQTPFQTMASGSMEPLSFSDSCCFDDGNIWTADLPDFSLGCNVSDWSF